MQMLHTLFKKKKLKHIIIIIQAKLEYEPDNTLLGMGSFLMGSVNYSIEYE